jgi:uncharacterized protein (DUF983 family)
VNSRPKTSYLTTLGRAWRLRCPRCGQQKLFKNLISMHPSCASCGLKYEREPGYFLGSIYVNYGLTTLLVIVGYFGLVFSGVLTFETALWVATAFTVVFPIFFFRYARSLWLGFDHYWDPTTVEPPQQSGHEQNGHPQNGVHTSGSHLKDGGQR